MEGRYALFFPIAQKKINLKTEKKKEKIFCVSVLSGVM